MCNASVRADDRPGVAGNQRPEITEEHMNKMMIRLSTLIRQQADADDRGGVAAEYGVLLAGIVAVVAIAAAALGTRVGGLFDSILP